VNLDVTVKGVPQALRELKKVDPQLRKQIPDKFKNAAAPVLAEARRLVPLQPLSGWKQTGRLGWRANRAKNSIRLRFRATRGRRRTPGDFTVLALTSGKDPALQVYDMAGRKSRSRTKSGQAMVAQLNTQSRPSRVMWEAVERKEPFIRDEIAAITQDVERLTSRKIERVR
jgi:hypothetical protein